jgi:hypothetical protein
MTAREASHGIRRRTRRMDAAVPVDAQNAPTATWKTAQNAVSHSAHTHDRLYREERTEPRRSPGPHTKFLTLPTALVNVPRDMTGRASEPFVRDPFRGLDPCQGL